MIKEVINQKVINDLLRTMVEKGRQFF